MPPSPRRFGDDSVAPPPYSSLTLSSQPWGRGKEAKKVGRAGVQGLEVHNFFLTLTLGREFCFSSSSSSPDNGSSCLRQGMEGLAALTGGGGAKWTIGPPTRCEKTMDSKAPLDLPLAFFKFSLSFLSGQSCCHGEALKKALCLPPFFWSRLP